MHHQPLAGALFFAAGVVALMGIITAETFYPGYSTRENTISDLGASMPPESIIVEPSATIFNATMVVSGLLIIAGALLLLLLFGAAGGRGRGRSRGFALLALLVGLFGVGVLGVGIFPGNNPVMHPIFSILAFVAGGLSAVASGRLVAPPFRELSEALGAIALLNLALFFAFGLDSPFMKLGIGGLERWVAYPIVLWTVGFGGYLMGSSGSDL
jgi:hypothetical membrane protein